MGYVLSKLLWFRHPADYDVPDPSTGLTQRDKDIVTKTWKLFRADLKANGIKLFMKLFQEYPEYQHLFKAFADIPMDKLATNGRLIAHVTSVMYAMSSLIDNLDDLECLVELLHKIGISHKPRNLKAEHFQNLAKGIISTLEDILGTSVMDDAAKEAWSKTLQVANGEIIKSLESADG